MEIEDLNLIYEEEEKERVTEEQARVFNDYIDTAYYYFNENADLVYKNLRSLQKNDDSALINYFHPVISGIQLTKEQTYNLIVDFMLNTSFDIKVYIQEVVTKYNEKRFYDTEDSISVSVTNTYGDEVYYNKEKLEYLRNLFGNIKDKNVRKEIERLRKNAIKKNQLLQNLGIKLGVNYSNAEHVEYKYYLNLFSSAFRVTEEYVNFKKHDEEMNVKSISLLEFTELRLSQEMLREKCARGR